MKKPVKITLLSILFLVAVAASFVLADYYALFGLKKYLVTDYAESTFKPVDKDTGAPVLDVKIRCFQKGTNNACAQKESRSLGEIIIRVPVKKLVWESLLFKNKEELLPTDDPNVQVMFIHYNYNNPVETLSIEEIYHNPVNGLKVQMERKFLGESSNSEDSES